MAESATETTGINHHRVPRRTDGDTLYRQVGDLRSLYRSARRMSRIDDVDYLFNAIVDDIITATDLQRIVALQIERNRGILEGKVFYGFDPCDQNLSQPFDKVNGLLKKVYTEREPLNVVDASVLGRERGNGPIKCRIYRDDFKGRNRRRQCINCCCLGEGSDTSKCYSGDSFKHYSVCSIFEHDECIRSLIGNSNSFLIIPICDDQDFYGYILADKGESREVVSYEEARIASAIVSHASLAIARAIKQEKMLQKIARQHRELQKAHEHLEDRLAEIGQVKNFYENIIQNLKSGLLSVDIELNFTHVNAAAEQMLGYSKDDLLGKPLDFIIAADSGKRCIFMENADELDTEHGYLADVEMRRKDGTFLPVQACLSAMTDREGEISGLSCIFRDISQRKLIEKHLSRVDKLASLGELAAGMAHEIKNPLAGIAGAMQILAGKQKAEEADNQLGMEIFEEIFRQIKKLDSFVNNLLEFARPVTPLFKAVDIEKCISSSLFLASNQLDQKNIEIEMDYGVAPPMVNGDETLLQQLFLNLIINAIDAMDDGGRLFIHICWEGKAPQCRRSACISSYNKKVPDCLYVVIKDTGCGIQQNQLEAIFNPFHTTKSTGTGLGLSIAHRVVEQHSGSIYVECGRRSGAIFTVCLPLFDSKSASHERKACINCR